MKRIKKMHTEPVLKVDHLAKGPISRFIAVGSAKAVWRVTGFTKRRGQTIYHIEREADGLTHDADTSALNRMISEVLL